MSGGGLRSAQLSIHSLPTHTVGYLAFRQNKRGFSAAALEPLARLMHLNVSAVVRGHGVTEEPALLIGPKMETQFCLRARD